MFLISKIPKEERPRERLLKHGPEVLSLVELLAVIIGRGVKDESVFDISQKLILKFGSLENLYEATVQELRSVKGIGDSKICQLKACFEIARRINFFKESNFLNKKTNKKYQNKKFITPEDIFLQIRGIIKDYNKENFLVVCLDNKNSIIGTEIVSIGILNRTLVHPRETFRAAIKNHSAQIILAHNHPTGDTNPSEDDVLITKKLVEAGKIIGISVIDHLIISKSSYFSFAEKNLL